MCGPGHIDAARFMSVHPAPSPLTAWGTGGGDPDRLGGVFPFSQLSQLLGSVGICPLPLAGVLQLHGSLVMMTS